MLPHQKIAGGSRGFVWLVVFGFAGLWLVPLTESWQKAPDLGHAWAVPLLMGYLWWERWAERPATIARTSLRFGWWLLAFAIVTLALPLRLLLTPFPVWPQLLFLFTSLYASVALAAAWLIGGRQGVKWIAGPMILSVAALPLPGVVESMIIMPLRIGMAALAADLSNLFGQPALASGTSIQLARTWVGIDEACGGIRSLQACILIGLFFGEWYRFSLPRRIMLIGAAVLAALLGNFGRIMFLAFRADAGSSSVESAHDIAGWLAMIASLALTGILAWRWAGYTWPQQRIIPRPGTSTSVGWIWFATITAALALEDVATRWWYVQGEDKRPSAPQWTVDFPTTNPSFRDEPLPKVAREVLRPDHYIAGKWTHVGGSASAYYIEWIQGQAARSAPFDHNPTVCLPLAGCELMETLPFINVPWTAGPIPFRAYKFRRAGELLLVAFVIWDPVGGRPLTQERVAHSRREWWALQWTEVQHARQHQPAQLLTVTLPWHHREEMPALLASLVKPEIRP